MKTKGKRKPTLRARTTQSPDLTTTRATSKEDGEEAREEQRHGSNSVGMTVRGDRTSDGPAFSTENQA